MTTRTSDVSSINPRRRYAVVQVIRARRCTRGRHAAIDFVVLKHKPPVMNAPLNLLRGFGRDPPLCVGPGSPGAGARLCTHVFSNPILPFTIIRLHAAFHKVVSSTIQRLLRRSASIVYIVLTVFVGSAGCCLRCLAFYSLILRHLGFSHGGGAQPELAVGNAFIMSVVVCVV